MYETDEYQVVCVKVLSGDIAGRNININYKTTSDTAQGILLKSGYNFICTLTYTVIAPSPLATVLTMCKVLLSPHIPNHVHVIMNILYMWG